MKLKILFFLLWISAFSALFAQNASECMAIARAQIGLGNDEAARLLMQRVIYFDRKTYGLECYWQLATINFRLEDFDQSAFFFDILYQNSPSDSIKNMALIGKASALLLQGRHAAARRELLSIKDTLNGQWYYKRQVYLGACYYGERNFDASEAIYKKILKDNSNTRKTALKKAYKKARRINKRNPKTAKIMSMFVPGSGQIYAGDIKNGLNSLGLNAVMAYWFIYTLQKASLNDAILSTGSWVFRYYAGGFKRAAIITEAEKDKRLKQNFQNILKIID